MCAITSDTPGRVYLKCNNRHLFDFNLFFYKCPKLLYLKKHRLWNVQPAAKPAGRLSFNLWFHLIFKKKQKKKNTTHTNWWMWSGFSRNHFCFDAGKGGGRRSDIAQNLHIKRKVCCRWKKYDCGCLFLFDIFLSAWHHSLRFTLSSCVCREGTCYRSSLRCIGCRHVKKKDSVMAFIALCFCSL